MAVLNIAKSKKHCQNSMPPFATRLGGWAEEPYDILCVEVRDESLPF
jgi:hypothetical protein